MTRMGSALFSLILFFCCLSAETALARVAQTAPDRQIIVMLRLATPHLRADNGYGGSYGDDAARGARRRIAGRIARLHRLTIVTDWPMPLLGVDCFVMAVPDGRSTDAAASEIANDPAVSWSEPVTLYTAQSGPVPHEDALFPAQPAAGQWHLTDIHARTVGQGVTVAVIDSGVDGHHPDLNGQIALSRNFVEGPDRVEAHGTAVAGIIAARADRQGIVGVAPGAHILALRACWQQTDVTLCDSLSLAKAVQFAVERRAPVINMSLSGAPSRLLTGLLRIGLDRGATVVAAYDAVLANGGFPASLPGVVAVSDREDIAMVRPVYVAPGRDVPAPQPGGRWSLVNGSSFAAAHVSGVFALLRSRPVGSFRLASVRRGGGAIDMCATFGIDNCGASRLAR